MTTSPTDENTMFAWLEGIDVAATVCDRQGICLYLNQRAAQAFAKHGGQALVGKNLLDCHPEPARSRFAAQLATPTPNSYTIEKDGVRKLIHQIPWHKDGVFSGVVELGFPLPESLPHFVRTPG
jgi:transcriptional regulator with PAS, ATPase and Fis domain